MKLMHLSDPHFGTVRPDVEVALRAEIANLKPDLILMTGDITQRARRAQFEAAREFVDSLSLIPVYAVPGNHDIPLFNIAGRLTAPLFGFKRYFSPEARHYVQSGSVEIVMLNSAKRHRHIDGELDESELRAALAQFSAAAAMRVVAFHHPMDCPGVIDEQNLIIGHARLAEVCSESRVDIILGGHIHNPVTRLSNTRYPGLERNFIITVGGTCLSHRIRPPSSNSFSLLTINAADHTLEAAGSLQLARFEFSDGGRFHSKERFYFTRSAAGWSLR